MKALLLTIVLLINIACVAQKANYTDSLKKYQQEYVNAHEVVKEQDWKYFKFFPVDKKYRIIASFQKIDDAKGFIMKTSGTKTPQYFKYGLLTFTLDNKVLHLTVYQSQQLSKDDKYKDYLFVPFTDLTSGNKSYGGGKYMDFKNG